MPKVRRVAPEHMLAVWHESPHDPARNSWPSRLDKQVALQRVPGTEPSAGGLAQPWPESLTALAAFMARHNESWTVMQRQFVSLSPAAALADKRPPKGKSPQGPRAARLEPGRPQTAPPPGPVARPLVCQDAHGQDHPSPGGVDGHNRHGEEQDPGQGRHSP